MIVFNNYFKILKRNITAILLYALVFIGFGMFAATMGNSSTEFVASKPNVAIINKSDSKIIKEFVKYINENTTVKKVDEENLKDALFYREVEYIFYIKEDFSQTKKIDTYKVPDSTSSAYIEMIFNRYLNVIDTYLQNGISEEDALILIKKDLDYKSKVNIIVDDEVKINMANYYFNFSNYAILAIIIFAISTILTAFKKDAVNKRNRVSSMSYKKINKELLLASVTFTTIIFAVVALFGFIYFPSVMLSTKGILIIINLFIFTMCATSFGLLISNFIKNKDALTGVVNITALGSSFISGAFVPQFILGNFVIGVAHLFPSYYFISNNNIVAAVSNYSLKNLDTYLINLIAMILFDVGFYIANNHVSKNKE